MCRYGKVYIMIIVKILSLYSSVAVIFYKENQIQYLTKNPTLDEILNVRVSSTVMNSCLL